MSGAQENIKPTVIKPGVDRLALIKRIRWNKTKKIPYRQQTSASDCGSACLAMVLGYYGKDIPQEEVRNIVGVSRSGANALNVLQAGRWYGLRGRGVNLTDISKLTHLPAGTILHWDFRHFVVFEKLRRNEVHILDPATGRRKVSLEQFSKSFTGIALIFEPGESFVPEARRKTGLKRYLYYLLQEKQLLIKIIVSSVVLQLLALVIPIVTGLLVDRVVPRSDQQLLMMLLLGSVVIMGFYLLSSLLRSHLLVYLQTRLNSKFTLDFLEHLVGLSYGFFEQRSIGDLNNRMNSNSEIREILTSGAMSAVLDGTLVLLYLLLLIIINIKIALLVMALGFVRVLVFTLTRKSQKDLMAEVINASANTSSYQMQLLAGMETLKSCGAEDHTLQRWSNIFTDQLNVLVRQGALNAKVDSLLGTLAIGSPLLILALGGHLVMAGELTLGSMLAAVALATGFLTPLSSLVNESIKLQRLFAYMERINDVMSAKLEQDATDKIIFSELKGAVSVNKVEFSYSVLAPPVLKDISLNIEPGQFVALVGPSGSGKSTLARLLAGLHLPKSGVISYDSINLERLNLVALRKQMGIVSQQPYIFGTSIKDNIQMNYSSASFEELVSAAKLACIHDDIMSMPMTYDTMLSEGGGSLSGGQLQRIALARALITQPRMLILDEATSALDVITENNIQLELEQLQITRVVIAHRLSTIINADLILVLDNGELVEQGTHRTLLNAKGQYARLMSIYNKKNDSESS